jgi:hypothetical protein
VRRRELDVEVARVPGVDEVSGVNLFERRDGKWSLIGQKNGNSPVAMNLESWQLPELLAVVVMVGDTAPLDLRAAPDPFDGDLAMAVPVVPEVC